MSSSTTERKDATVKQKDKYGRAADLVKEYDGDLNVVLILAGLLSAVSSAVALYVYPQLQTDHNEETADLLRVILYKMDNTTFGGDIPQVPRWTGTPRTTVVAIILIFLSLGFTTTSVLVAILAKQMLYLYALTAVSESDTEGGLDQQPGPGKFDRISRSVVFVLFSLLQLALLFLGCSIAVYTWNINYMLALLMLCATMCLVPVYFIFVLLVLANLDLLRLTPLKKIRIG